MASSFSRHMTGAEHYARAEELIQTAEDQRSLNNDRASAAALIAQAHLMAAQQAWTVAASLFDAGLAADPDDAKNHTAGGVLDGWPEAVL